MDVSPQTLREVEFREKLRGYNQDDVDEFLERVAAGVEILQDRLRQATDRALRAEQRASEIDEADEAVRKTLVLAQRTADLAVQEAKEQAARALDAAKAEAKRIEAEASAQARRIAQEAQGRLRADLAALEVARSRLRSDVTALERHVEEQRGRVRDAMRDALKRLDSHVPAVAPAPAGPTIDIPPAPVVDDDEGERVDEVVVIDPPASMSPSDAADAPDAEPESAQPSPYADFVDDDDAFLAELRLAATDTSPLGPREVADAPAGHADEPDPPFDHEDHDDHDDHDEVDEVDDAAEVDDAPPSRWRRR
jgi:cell division initiation protein